METKVIDIRGDDAGMHTCFSGWWLGHGTQVVPVDVLPKCGVLVVDDTGPLAVAWLYMDNSVGVAWLGWVTTNPAITPWKATAALHVLLGAAEVVAKGMDYGCLFTMTDRPGLSRWLVREGFSANHAGMTQFFKLI